MMLLVIRVILSSNLALLASSYFRLYASVIVAIPAFGSSRMAPLLPLISSALLGEPSTSLHCSISFALFRSYSNTQHFAWLRKPPTIYDLPNIPQEAGSRRQAQVDAICLLLSYDG